VEAACGEPLGVDPGERAVSPDVAVVKVILRSASSEASARGSWTKPMVAFSRTITAIASGVSH
jgi:hypothetical protein